MRTNQKKLFLDKCQSTLKMSLVSDCGSAVEFITYDQDVMGLYPTGCWAFFLFPYFHFL